MAERNVQARRAVVLYKMHMRGNAEVLEELWQERRLLGRAEKMCDAKDVFRRRRLRALLEELEPVIETAREARRNIAELLVLAVRAYDKAPASLHEKAQLLSIDHRLIEAIRNPDGSEPSLEDLAFRHHAEVAGEGEEFIGEKGHRDYPIFKAFQEVFMRLLDEDQEFRDLAEKAFDKCFPGLPRYQLVIRPDGSREFRRLPPKLTVVDGGRAS